MLKNIVSLLIMLFYKKMINSLRFECNQVFVLWVHQHTPVIGDGLLPLEQL
jgi:hypothetical protein